MLIHGKICTSNCINIRSKLSWLTTTRDLTREQVTWAKLKNGNCSQLTWFPRKSNKGKLNTRRSGDKSLWKWCPFTTLSDLRYCKTKSNAKIRNGRKLQSFQTSATPTFRHKKTNKSNPTYLSKGIKFCSEQLKYNRCKF